MDRNPTVVIIGAGMTGIAAAYYLRANRIPYVILEAKEDVGGVWNSHRWHGARCDSDFIKYSFSFKPFLSGECLQSRETIHGYLRAVAAEYSMLEHIRFNCRVSKAVFNTGAQCWTVHTDQGTVRAQFILNGNGYFADEPHVPEFRDAGKFKGEIVHTSHLDGRRSFAGKKVLLVGSGATAICSAPELARVSGSLVLLQRSPSYIYETSNRADWLIRTCQNFYRWGWHTPVKWLRKYLQLRDDLVFVGFRAFPRLARWFFRRHWIGAVGEVAFKQHFTPRYAPWEQRIAVAIGLKETLRSGGVAFKTGEIERFTEGAVVLKSGERIDCDACILATGLNLRFFSFDLYIGAERIALERINFYKGLMVGGIPNYFHPMGSWHSAWTQRLEPVTRLAVRVMRHMDRNRLGVVSVERRELPAAPGITPNYVMRCLSTLPRLHGTTNLPSLDNLFAVGLDTREFRFYPAIVSPPDTLITCPVMNAASSEARNATMPGMSSGWPTRFIGIARTRAS
jgi:monooxygenase